METVFVLLSRIEVHLFSYVVLARLFAGGSATEVDTNQEVPVFL